MAFDVKQINPIDFLPSVAVGVALPFSAKNAFRSTYTTQDALKSNLVNYLLTDTGERFMNPNLGAGLRPLLFDQMTDDNTDAIESAIRRGISTWFNNISLTDLKINQSPDTNSVSILIKYKINNTNVQDQLVINFQQ
jgi:phage baseplate assembly protein W